MVPIIPHIAHNENSSKFECAENFQSIKGIHKRDFSSLSFTVQWIVKSHRKTYQHQH